MGNRAAVSPVTPSWGRSTRNSPVMTTPKLLVQLKVEVMGRAGVPGQLELMVFWLGQSHLQYITTNISQLFSMSNLITTASMHEDFARVTD